MKLVNADMLHLIAGGNVEEVVAEAIAAIETITLDAIVAIEAIEVDAAAATHVEAA